MSAVIARVHRFRNTVAVHVGDGATTYLTPIEALNLAEALATCAGDIEDSTFTNSRFPTTEITKEEVHAAS